MSLPAWLGPWANKHRRLERGELVEGLARVLEVIRGRARLPTKTSAPPVLRLWAAMLDEAGAVRELVAAEELSPVELGLQVADLVRLGVLLAEAARDCPASIFARDLRAEDWPTGKDRSRIVAAVCRLSPSSTSSGATWLERLEVAEAWKLAGRPLAGWPLGAPTTPSTRPGGAPRSIAERLASRSGSPLQLIPGGVE